jgi:Fur family iron response transcriptional regulator
MRSNPAKSQVLLKNEMASRLRTAGLRPTRQRLALGGLLFAQGDRHVTAEALHVEAIGGGIELSLATVYNTLHQFTGAGLLRQVTVGGDKAYFDTNTGNHHHFYIDAEQRLIDIPGDRVQVHGLPNPPAGAEIDRVDVIVRIKAR